MHKLSVKDLFTWWAGNREVEGGFRRPVCTTECARSCLDNPLVLSITFRISMVTIIAKETRDLHLIPQIYNTYLDRLLLYLECRAFARLRASVRHGTG